MPIEQVKIRAKIEVGSLIVETPFILSFSVTKQRGSLSNFSAKLKVSHSTVNGPISGSEIKIYAGTDSNQPLIFTGVVSTMQITPVFDDPAFVNISLSGTDTLRLLSGKKFTRRCRSTKATWVSINGVVREKLKSGKFKYVKQNYFDVTDGDWTSSEIVNTAAQSVPKEVPLPPQASAPKVTLRVTPFSDEEGVV